MLFSKKAVFGMWSISEAHYVFEFLDKKIMFMIDIDCQCKSTWGVQNESFSMPGEVQFSAKTISQVNHMLHYDK